jgi:CDP-glucose 4,6-dehydratase
MPATLEEFYKNKKVLITGHSGFKGGWLSKILLNWGADVTGLSLEPGTKPNLFNELGIKHDIHNYFCDIRNFKQLKEIFFKQKPEIIFHLAAQPIVRDSYDDPLRTFEINIMGTANVLHAIKETSDIRAGVIITTDKVYENKDDGNFYTENDRLGGHDPYSSSKAGAEIVVSSYIKSFFNPLNHGKTHQTLVASARAGNVIGGGDWAKDRIITDIVRAIFEKDEAVIVRNPLAVRPWQHVLEPLNGYLLLAKGLFEGRQNFSGAWNFGPNADNCLSVEELAKRSIKILGRGRHVVKGDTTKHETQLLRLSSEKAKKVLNWQSALNIDQTLTSTFDWYKKFYDHDNIIEITNQQITLYFLNKTYELQSL